MGKISDALERRRKETALKSEKHPLAVPERIVEERSPKIISKPLLDFTGFSHKLVVVTAPDSMDAENFKVLRGQILFPQKGEPPRCIMVTSAFPGEGKTYVAANLAVSIALGINEHVLMVDCDLRRPSLHKMLGYKRAEGLREYLRGERDLPELLVKTKIDKLSLLMAGKPAHNPSELLASSAMREFIREVKNRYDDRYIILDATPSQVTAEANVLAHNVDGVVFVVMNQKAPRETVRRSIENLGKNKIIGIVFNGYSKSYKAYDKYYKRYYK
ncbi:MAG: polysaccharide biosynthesis tyrosine autokinase [Deltaproteobacteria bacterium]|nr:polysaccharide biosynthesis tyrosine autokinase [Deltaproteobacteria bacterium]MBW1951060.1 polysaccharide biosynthesis tyrosine autokinase [Deltaproteobacteria bacterium]MBW2006851.1 polysaccharide biosynthesis tyrosine autokinase [Deltaproteobacteria bacterium]MBW2102633.1 polysaccharide biosynthesis tyrosine autokinase [Deltaproteobacteria bacterium]MBW2349352.1 polysaccharide biosynthesis tyrosine autokinase [Deltaproteobacteria bacterium]